MQAKVFETPVFNCKKKKCGMGRCTKAKWEQLVKFSFVQLVELFLAVGFQKSLFMEDTHSGVTGVRVVRHVEEALPFMHQSPA